jgi:5'(3')-deoxyribonucleotidase
MGKIIIDLDDTLYDLCTPWIKYLNETTGKNIQPFEITNWNMSTYYPELSKTELYRPLNDCMVWPEVEVFENAVETINEFMREGHEVVFCTATHPIIVSKKMEQTVYRFFPNWDYHNLIICHKKDMIRGDVLIDDGPHNLKNFQGHRILFTAPHNRNINAGVELSAIRCNNWKDVQRTISLIF